jgi:O-antigen ligase
MSKRIFNILLYTFVILVPAMPLKEKIKGIPLSSDLVVGGLLILTGAIIVLSDFKNIKKKTKEIIKNDKAILFLVVVSIAFTLMSIISVSYSRNKVVCLTETVRFLEYVAIFYFIVMLCGRKEISNIFYLFMLVMFGLGLYGLVQFAFNLSTFTDVTILNRGRVYATFENPNYWGAAVNMVIFVPLCVFFEKRLISKRMKAFLIGFEIVMFLNLVLNLTRASWLGFELGLILLAVMRYRKALVYLFSTFIAGMLIPTVRNRFLSSFTIKSFTVGERLKLWKTGLYMFRDHFWTGVGNGNYLYNYYDYMVKYRELDFNKKAWSVHNSYIKMFAELGIFGGLFFVSIYLSLAYITLKIYRRS